MFHLTFKLFHCTSLNTIRCCSTSPYRVLNLHPGASRREVKKAYIQMSKKYHPDVTKSPEAEARVLFQNVLEAYEILSKPELKGKIDAGEYYARQAKRRQAEAGYEVKKGHDTYRTNEDYNYTHDSKGNKWKRNNIGTEEHKEEQRKKREEQRKEREEYEKEYARRMETMLDNPKGYFIYFICFHYGCIMIVISIIHVSIS